MIDQSFAKRCFNSQEFEYKNRLFLKNNFCFLLFPMDFLRYLVDYKVFIDQNFKEHEKQ